MSRTQGPVAARRIAAIVLGVLIGIAGGDTLQAQRERLMLGEAADMIIDQTRNVLSRFYADNHRSYQRLGGDPFNSGRARESLLACDDMPQATPWGQQWSVVERTPDTVTIAWPCEGLGPSCERLERLLHARRTSERLVHTGTRGVISVSRRGSTEQLSLHVRYGR